MQEWFESVAGPDYAGGIMLTLMALLALLVILLVIRLFRRFTFGTFVAGGRNRKARLAVMDATAVDSHRRLVLVRRDDIEHLILIGGPTDVVVEQNIRLLPPARRTAGEEAGLSAAPALDEPPAPQPVQQPRPIAPAPVQVAPRPQPVAPAVPPQPLSAPPASASPNPAPAQRYTPPPTSPHPVAPAQYASSAQRPTPPVQPSAPPPANPSTDFAQPVRTLRPVAPVTAAVPVAAVAVAQPAATQTAPLQHGEAPSLDDALLEELQATLDRDQQKPQTNAADRTLDDEMSKLLGDLSGKQN